MKKILFGLWAFLMATFAVVASIYPAATVAAATARVHELARGIFFGPTQLEAGRFNGALTLTGLIPVIYQAMEIVSRELVGFIGAVSRDSSAERAAVNQVVMSPVVGPMTAEDILPAAFAADTPTQTIGNVQMTIQRARSVPFGVTGEEFKGLQNAGTYDTINRDRIAQALRTLSNEVETDLAALHVAASRAYGTAAGTLFGTAADLTDLAQTRRILDDNGVPQSDLHLVLGSSPIANIRGKQSNLFKVNEAGSSDLLRFGVIGDIEGFAVHNSGQIRVTAAVGTAAASTVNATGYAVGATTLGLSVIGTGSILAGDIVTFAGDTNQYVVAVGDADVSNGGTIVLAEPGLRVAMSAATKAITVIAATARNMAFHRSAIQLATRAPAMPPGGDAADDMMLVTDPVSGITYEFLIYRQKRQIRYEVNLAWGVKMVAPRHAALLIGA